MSDSAEEQKAASAKDVSSPALPGTEAPSELAGTPTRGGGAAAEPDSPSSLASGPPEARPVAVKPGKSPFARAFDWFWLSPVLKVEQEPARRLSPRGQRLLQRARVCLELGNRTLEPVEPLDAGSGDGVACELYRESIYWSLAAALERGVQVAPSVPTTLADDHLDFPELVGREQALFERAAGGPEAAASLAKELSQSSFRSFAELPAAEQSRLAAALRGCADSLVHGVDTARLATERIWLQRALRVLAVLVLIGLAAWGINKAREAAQLRNDLARSAKWTASSRYPEGGCESPTQNCAESPNFFFHTHEEANPSIVFDLGGPRTVSGVLIRNRLDCCYDRAIPLIVEVSNDGKNFREVARRTAEFSTWREKFTPVQTKYVRLRVGKTANLHLREVRLLP